MPKLMNQAATVVAQTVSNFGFSTKKISELGGNEFTLADLEIDVSPSTSPFKADLEKALGTIVEALRKSPRAKNMLVRVQKFDENLNEIHGFVGLHDINPADYDLSASGGATALFDATLCGVEAVAAYGKDLDGLDMNVNGVVFIVTDGMNNASTVATEARIAQIAAKARMDEHLESLKVILIGVGNEGDVKDYLKNFTDNAKIDQYVWIGDATPGKIAKLAEFISRSVSSASQSLGTGGPSANLTF